MLYRLLRIDKLSFLTLLFLLGIGLAFIYCAGMDYGGVPSRRWIAQLFWIFAGFGLYFTFACIDYHVLAQYSGWAFLGGLALLALVFVSGGREFGARSVLRVLGIGIQVSEPMKAAALVFIAYVLSHPILKYSLVPPIVVWAALIMLPFGMVLLQGDGGTALVFLPFSFCILFINGLRWRWLFILLALFLTIVPVGFKLLKPYQKMRILVFMQMPCESAIEAMPLIGEERRRGLYRALDSFVDAVTREVGMKDGKPKWDDWNARQIQLSVGSGELHGKGYMKGKQHTLGFLPRTVAPTDFIFGVISEEAGFVGAISVLLAFLLMIALCFRTACLSADPLGSSIAVGAAVIYGTHVFINIGMCIGLAPIIGIPLPFVSYGGSCMLGMMMVAGLVQSVHASNGYGDINI